MTIAELQNEGFKPKVSHRKKDALGQNRILLLLTKIYSGDKVHLYHCSSFDGVHYTVPMEVRA